MSNRIAVMRIVYFAGLLSMAACSGQSPSAPSAGDTPATTVLAGGASGAAAPAAAPALAPGSYQLMFIDSSGAEVASMPVLTDELGLKARVTDSAGQPAQGGSVTFEYCAFKKLPPNDITRADEAPMAECASGAARWKSLLMMPLNPLGEAAMSFGFVRIPRTVGFRFRYKGTRSSGIADGIGGPRDFVWTAAE